MGRFRRAHLVPVPVGLDLAGLNELCRAGDVADDARRIGTRARTVGEDFAAERPYLLALPAEPFRRRPVPAGAAGRHQSEGVRAPVLVLGARPPRRAHPPGGRLGALGGHDTHPSTGPPASDPGATGAPPCRQNRRHGQGPPRPEPASRTLTTAKRRRPTGPCPARRPTPTPPSGGWPPTASPGRPAPTRTTTSSPSSPAATPPIPATYGRSLQPPTPRTRSSTPGIIRCRMVQVGGLLAHPGRRRERPPGRLQPPDDGGPGPAGHRHQLGRPGPSPRGQVSLTSRRGRGPVAAAPRSSSARTCHQLRFQVELPGHYDHDDGVLHGGLCPSQLGAIVRTNAGSSWPVMKDQSVAVARMVLSQLPSPSLSGRG